MKKILLLSTVFISSFLLSTSADAQFRASINIGVQPEWGPAGYDYAENYYLPDVEAYYSVARRQFVYFDRGNWVYASSLPGRCGNYDLYSGYKVVINERDPWFHFNNHRVQYSNYRFRHDQAVIRDRHGRGDGYGRPGYDDRNRDRDRNYRNDSYRGRDERRYDRGRDNDRRNDSRDRGHGRW